MRCLTAPKTPRVPIPTGTSRTLSAMPSDGPRGRPTAMSDLVLELPGGPAEVTITGNRDEVRRYLVAHPVVAFDVETIGLDPAEGRLRMLQLGTADSALVIPA